jgi:hypothetical protein
MFWGADYDTFVSPELHPIRRPPRRIATELEFRCLDSGDTHESPAMPQCSRFPGCGQKPMNVMAFQAPALQQFLRCVRNAAVDRIRFSDVEYNRNSPRCLWPGPPRPGPPRSRGGGKDVRSGGNSNRDKHRWQIDPNARYEFGPIGEWIAGIRRVANAKPVAIARTLLRSFKRSRVKRPRLSRACAIVRARRRRSTAATCRRAGPRPARRGSGCISGNP